MTYDRDELGDALLPPLDAEPGPMPQLSASEAEAIAWGAVSRWAARLPGLEPADDGQGPAHPLAAEHAERLAHEVVRLQARRRARRSAPWLLKAAVALLVCGLAGVSAAAYRFWPAWSLTAASRPRREALPKRAAPAAPAPVEPAAAPPSAALTPQAAPAAQPHGQGPSLEELLASANALRAQRRWLAAERLYRQALAAAAPNQQRYVALVAAASINAQHLGRPERALAQYQSALKLVPHGELSEEAQLGIADCQHALGDTQAELRTLEQFSKEHPQSWMMENVRRRRAELAP